jgi:hypothetical protein
MEERADEEFRLADLHIPVSHNEAIELIKKRLNPKGYDII